MVLTLARLLVVSHLILLARADVVVDAGCFGYGCASLKTTFGSTMRGNVWKENVEFLMIPFGRINSSFDPPSVAQSLPSDPYDATNILADGSAACIQPGPPFTPSGSYAYGVKQCLLLDLYAPKVASPSLRPIMIWLFGGPADMMRFNASILAGKHDAIVASANFRFGAFGFSAFQEDADAGLSTGNAGLHDCLTAAMWLKQQAPALGANPKNIVFFGESSGGMHAGLLSLLPSAKGLVAGSISESGQVSGWGNSLSDAIESTRSAGKAIGCKDEGLKACMSANVFKLINSSSGNDSPTVDKVFMPAMPEDMLANGGLEGMRILWGGNTNDSASPSDGSWLDRHKYIEQLNSTVGQSLLKEALKLYPPAPHGKDSGYINADQIGWYTSDQFLCGVRSEVLAGATTGKAAHSYMYRFDWSFRSDPNCTKDGIYHDPASGSNHCDDLPFVFGQPVFDGAYAPGLGYTNCSDPKSKYYDEGCIGCAFNEAEGKLAFDVGALWVAFAAGDDLDNKGWPQVTKGKMNNIVLHPTDKAFPTEVDMGRTEACILWDKVGSSGTKQVAQETFTV